MNIYKGNDIIKASYKGTDSINSGGAFKYLGVEDYAYFTGSCWYIDGGIGDQPYTSSIIDTTAISQSQTYTVFYDNVVMVGTGYLGATAIPIGFYEGIGVLEYTYTGGAGDNTHTLKVQNITVDVGAGGSYSVGYVGVVYDNGNYKIYLGSTTPSGVGTGMTGIITDTSYFFIKYDGPGGREVEIGACRPLLYDWALSQTEVEQLVDVFYS